METIDRKCRLAYFAGLIDGEGHITLTSRGTKRPKTPCIEVKMSCEKTVLSLKTFFDGGTVVFRRPAKIGYLPQWRWRVTDRQAISILKEILPFMITKQDAARNLVKQAGGHAFKIVRGAA